MHDLTNVQTLTLQQYIDILTEAATTKDFSDSYLESKGYPTRRDLIASESAYGVVSTPVRTVLPLLHRLNELQQLTNETIQVRIIDED